VVLMMHPVMCAKVVEQMIQWAMYAKVVARTMP
jgi:hypothetical protein